MPSLSPKTYIYGDPSNAQAEEYNGNADDVMRFFGMANGLPAEVRSAILLPQVNWLDNPDGMVYQRPIVATGDDVYAFDRWYALTQTGSVLPANVGDPENGYRTGMRFTQSQVTPQRYGAAQIIEGQSASQLRGKTVTYGGRFRSSLTQTIRCALLAWTGTENSVTSDVVSSWTNTSFTTGQFFNAANLTLIGASSAALNAGIASPLSVSGIVPSGATNLISMYWTDQAAAQSSTLDAWAQRVVEAAGLVEYWRRCYEEEEQRCQRRAELFHAGMGGVASGAQSWGASTNFKVRKAAIPTLSEIAVLQNANTSSAFFQNTTLDGTQYTPATTAGGAFARFATCLASCDL